MNLDITTLASISCIIYITQLIALLIQYIVDRPYHGIGWWLFGSSAYALGVIFMPLVNNKTLIYLAIISNPLIVIGQILIYVGVLKFLGKKVNRWSLITIFMVFILLYYYFMFGINSISARTIVGSSVLALLSLMTACRLYGLKGRPISGSNLYTALVFFAFGCYLVIRVFLVLFSPPIKNYSDQGLMLPLSFIIPLISNLLWTFGFIIMLNQRLNKEITQPFFCKFESKISIVL